MKRYLTTFLICLLAGQCAQAAENKSFYSDGAITTGQEWNSVTIWDTPPAHTTVNMTGGTVFSLSAYDASIVNISGGLLTNVSGLQNATLTISGTATINTASVGQSGILNMDGGSIGYLAAIIGQGVVNLRGGGITTDLSVKDLFVANVFGTSLAKTNSGGPSGYGRITGLWEDGSAFAINLANPETYSHINLVTIPEPVTLLLFGAALPLVRRFRKHA